MKYTTSNAAHRWRRSLPVRVAVATGALLIGGSPIAWAHPGFTPNSLTAGESTIVELIIEHDCEVPGGGASPTTFVAIQIPDAIALAEALPQQGWETNRVNEDGRVTEITWTAQEPAGSGPPVLMLRLTPATRDEPTILPLKVFQECEQGSYLWGGGGEDQPSVDLTIQAGTFTPPSPEPTSSPSSAPRPTEAPDEPDTPVESEEGATTDPENRSDSSRGWLALGAILALASVGAWAWWSQRG